MWDRVFEKLLYAYNAELENRLQIVRLSSKIEMFVLYE